MSSQFNHDEDVLGQLIRQAGMPDATLDPQYTEALRATLLARVEQRRSTGGTEAVLVAGKVPAITVERGRTMKRILKFTVAATILVAVGLLAFWGAGGGTGSIAFADVIQALDRLKTATYDFTSEIKNPVEGKAITIKSKGYFLAPALERVEVSMSFGTDSDATRSIMILDCLAAKGMTLLPDQKKALVINIATKETSVGGTASMFEMVRQLVREDGTNTRDTVESLGEKEIDGRTVVGFRSQNNMDDMTLWVDPQTAQLVRVDYEMPSGGGRMVMNNIRYNVDLDRSLFSLEPPEGYTVETQTVKTPTEEDLVNVLRFVAEDNKDTFPDSVGTNEKTFISALQETTKAESEKLFKTEEVQELMAKLKAQYGDDKSGFMKAWMKEWTEIAAPITKELTQKYMSGVMFYATLQPGNDSHYAGKGVKLNTPDQPILWYRPIGADKYRVIYADLSIKEMTPEEVKMLP